MTPRMPSVPTGAAGQTVRDGSRDGSLGQLPGQSTDLSRHCPVCALPCASTRARYCSEACKQRAYRARQRVSVAADPASLRRGLQRAGQLVAHTVYECPECAARLLGEQRCADCYRFCRALGLGGLCPHCDEPVLLDELLGLEGSPA